MAQHLRQIGAAELAGSTRAVREMGQADPRARIAGGGHITSLSKVERHSMAHLVTLSTACVLGFIHALEVDHMLAVTAFVSRRPTLATAARFGLRWGVGHSLAVLAAGGILLATGVRWGERYDRVGEAVVGLMLIAIGVWSLRSTRNLHVHLPAEHGDHAHLHTHHHGAEHHDHPHANPHHPHPHQPPAPSTRHSAPITFVGLIHGLAGTSAVVALVPVTLVDRALVGLAYLVAFGLGVTLAMTLFATVTAVAIHHASARSLAWGRHVSLAIGGAGILIGAWWIWSAAA
jgi:ABC-type nickel/cobalt efflux system permease component RcnA